MKVKDLAKQRFYQLVDLAFEMARKGEVDLASRIGYQAFKVARKGGYKIPKRVKRKFCRRCFTPLIPGVTATIRIRNKGVPTITVRCLNCGYVRRYPARKKEEKERK